MSNVPMERECTIPFRSTNETFLRNVNRDSHSDLPTKRSYGTKF